MNYAKPEITLLPPAHQAVRGSDIKQEHMILDNEYIAATTAAYEADE